MVNMVIILCSLYQEHHWVWAKLLIYDTVEQERLTLYLFSSYQYVSARFFGLHIWVDYNIHIDESPFIDNSQTDGGEIVFFFITHILS